MTVAALADDAAGARLPVAVITGFLGSGKTTLVNHILASRPDLRAGIIVNDLGELNIDSELIVSADDGMIELGNGCICCSLNTGFIDAVFRILQHGRTLDLLVVETTGVADPLPVALTFLRTELRQRVRLDSIVTVADAENFALAQFESRAARNQLAYGDVILLNKCDLVDAQQLQGVEQAIGEVASRPRIIRSTRCEVPLPLILGQFQAGEKPVDHALAHDSHAAAAHEHLAADGFEALAYQSERPFGVHKFQQFLEALPPNVFRAKGLLWMAESEQRYVFHLVARRFSLDERAADARRTNKLVLIGRNLDQARLRRELDGCLVGAN